MNKILSAVLLVTAINACTLQEVPDPTNGGGTITITAQTVQKQDVTNVPGTKTTLSGVETHWKGVDDYDGNADKIGIFSPEAKATSDGTPEANPAKNLAFTAQTSAKSSSFTGTMFWGDNVSHNFYAYYPRNSGFAGERTDVPISLPSAQIQSAAGNTAHIGALDFMVATPDTVQYGEAVNFTFNHVFVMIEFQIKGSGNLTQVSLNGADPLACEGTIDLTQTPEAGAYTVTTSSISKYVTVTLGSAASLNSTTAISVYMMVLPGSQNENLQIGVKIDGNWKEMSKTQPSGGFVRGKKYVVALNTEGAGWDATYKDNRDDKTYPYVTIGTQVWMTENLAYLPSVVGPDTGSETEPYYYVYDYEGTSVNDAKATPHYFTYGVLYNWTAALTACPDGWHLPSDAEWTTLTTYLGGLSVAGGKMKEAGFSHWTSPNTGATNESGFTALPGGSRDCGGVFSGIRSYGHWWSSTQYGTDSAWPRCLLFGGSDVFRDEDSKDYGFSVRCLRD
ncbi:MAG TPA: FISUMP domain-containing protein [Bacteroidales bacterium]|nr:FISUMP domain-containing protein [Bacteroidales bacterium]